MAQNRNEALENAIFALGCSQALGSKEDVRIGVLEAQACDHRPGTIVLVRDDGKTCTVSQPMPRDRIISGGAGFLTDYIPCLNSPKNCVRVLKAAEFFDLVRQLSD